MSINTSPFDTLDHAPLPSSDEESHLHPQLHNKIPLNLEQEAPNSPHRTTMQKLKAFLEHTDHQVHDVLFNEEQRKRVLRKYLHWKNVLTCMVSCLCLALLIAALVVGLIFFHAFGSNLQVTSFVVVDQADQNIRLFSTYDNSFHAHWENLNEPAKLLGGLVTDENSFLLVWPDRWEIKQATNELTDDKWKPSSGKFNSAKAIGFGYDYQSRNWIALEKKTADNSYHFISQDGKDFAIGGIMAEAHSATLCRHNDQVLILVTAEESTTHTHPQQQLFVLNHTSGASSQVDTNTYYFHTIETDVYADEDHLNELPFLATAFSSNDSLPTGVESPMNGGKLLSFSLVDGAVNALEMSTFIDVGELDAQRSFHSFYNYQEMNQGKSKTVFVRLTTLVTRTNRVYTINSRNARVYADSELPSTIGVVGLNPRLKD